MSRETPRKVLVVTPHPDDETLGLGGTLLAHRQRGDELYWLIVTAMSPEQGYSSEQIARRESELARVRRFYNFSGVNCLGFAAAALDCESDSRLTRSFSAAFQEWQPKIVYLPFKYDAHTDHQRAFQAGFAACKSFRCPSVQKVLMYETPSETDFAPALPGQAFTPTVYVDISPYFKQKLEVMKVYASELGEHPFPRSLEGLEALALVRGAAAGCRYAEAFMLLKDTSFLDA